MFLLFLVHQFTEGPKYWRTGEHRKAEFLRLEANKAGVGIHFQSLNVSYTLHNLALTLRSWSFCHVPFILFKHVFYYPNLRF